MIMFETCVTSCATTKQLWPAKTGGRLVSVWAHPPAARSPARRFAMLPAVWGSKLFATALSRNSLLDSQYFLHSQRALESLERCFVAVDSWCFQHAPYVVDLNMRKNKQAEPAIAGSFEILRVEHRFCLTLFATNNYAAHPL